MTKKITVSRADWDAILYALEGTEALLIDMAMQSSDAFQEVEYAITVASAVSETDPKSFEPAWRPIESAPKGATGYSWMLLAWGPEEDQSIGYGMHVDGKFYASATFYCLGQDRPYQMKEILVSPTHWMPLPAAPEAP